MEIWQLWLLVDVMSQILMYFYQGRKPIWSDCLFNYVSIHDFDHKTVLFNNT